MVELPILENEVTTTFYVLACCLLYFTIKLFNHLTMSKYRREYYKGDYDINKLLFIVGFIIFLFSTTLSGFKVLANTSTDFTYVLKVDDKLVKATGYEIKQAISDYNYYLSLDDEDIVDDTYTTLGKTHLVPNGSKYRKILSWYISGYLDSCGLYVKDAVHLLNVIYYKSYRDKVVTTAYSTYVRRNERSTRGYCGIK